MPNKTTHIFRIGKSQRKYICEPISTAHTHHTHTGLAFAFERRSATLPPFGAKIAVLRYSSHIDYYYFFIIETEYVPEFDVV